MDKKEWDKRMDLLKEAIMNLTKEVEELKKKREENNRNKNNLAGEGKRD